MSVMDSVMYITALEGIQQRMHALLSNSGIIDPVEALKSLKVELETLEYNFMNME